MQLAWRVRWLVMLVMVACVSSESSESSEIQLVESGVYRLPRGVSARGASISDQGRVAVWTGSDLYVQRDDTLAIIHPKWESRILSAAWTDTGSLEVVTLDRLVALDTSLQVASSQTIPAGILGAARTQSGWWFGTSKGKTLCLNQFPSPAEPLPVCSPWSESDTAVFFAASHDRLLVTKGGFKWAVYELEQNERRLRRIAADSSSPATNRLFVGLTAIPIDRKTVLQTIADLKSDTREFAAYAADGSWSRRRSIPVPLGLAGASSAGRFVVGILDVGHHEVIRYRR